MRRTPIPARHTYEPIRLGDDLPHTAQYELAPPGTGHLLVHVEITPSPEVPLGYIDGRPYGSYKACDTLTGGWWARYDDDGNLDACAPLGAAGIRYTARVFIDPPISDARRAWEVRFLPEIDDGARMLTIVAVLGCPHCRAANPVDTWGGFILGLDTLACPACGHPGRTSDLLA